jgi:hypothetical protein
MRLIIPLAMLGLLGCASEEGVQRRWDAFVAEHSECEFADDCAIVYPGCPLGCFDTVNVEHVEEAEDLADRLIRQYESFGRSCDYDCAEAPDPVCDAGSCTLPL